MPPITRSRNGCLSCRRRKRKCDEESPECGPCKQRGISCEGYAKTLRWVGGPALQNAQLQVVQAGTATNPEFQRERQVGPDSSASAHIPRDRPRALVHKSGNPVVSSEDRKLFEKCKRSFRV